MNNQIPILIRGLAEKRSNNADEIRKLSVRMLKIRAEHTIKHLMALIEVLVKSQKASAVDPKIQEAAIEVLCHLAKSQSHIENDNNVVPLHLLGTAQVHGSEGIVRALAESMVSFRRNSFVSQRVLKSMLEVLADPSWASSSPNSRIIAVDLIIALLAATKQSAISVCLSMLDMVDTSVPFRYSAFRILRETITTCTDEERERVITLCLSHIVNSSSTRLDFEVQFSYMLSQC